MKKLLNISPLLTFVVMSSVSAWAQTGTVSGRILDQTGALIPGVAIELTTNGTDEHIEILSESDGTFRFENLPLGPANITYRLLNFSIVRQDLTITTEVTVIPDIIMVVSTSADITITASSTFRNLADLANPAENMVGVASAGSEGAITATQLEARPANRAGEILETVPGMIVSQHSGEGKANQYYLRGFNLDHGFDFGQTIAGLPVNMPTHAHAQGYADVNFLIPELVSGVQYRKGPYYAENGDFSSAGSANINYFNDLDRSIVNITGGSFNYFRFLGATAPRIGAGSLLMAMEYEKDDGPWESPNLHDKYNSVIRYSQGDSRNGLSFTFMGFSNHWHSTDQVPKRAIDSGQISRFGFIEETDGGETYRYSLAGDWQTSGSNNTTRVTVFAMRYGVELLHNFTYFLNDPINGDQFEQFENRWTTGGRVTHRRLGHLGGFESESAVGVEIRNDSVAPLGLYMTKETQRHKTIREDDVDQVSVGIFGKTELTWNRVVRSTFGLRGDIYHWNVRAKNPLNSGTETSGLLSPKFSTVFGPWGGNEFYANWGMGFHSNNALGLTLKVDPFTGKTADPAPAFSRSHGGEFGFRSVAVPNLQTTTTVWFLRFDSELIYVGDSGNTEVGPASSRTGIEITNYYRLNPWATLDLDLAFSKARLNNLPKGQNFIPGSLNRVLSGGLTFAPPQERASGPFGTIRLRHFGPRPLTKSASAKSTSTSILNSEAGYKFSGQFRLGLEIFNLLNAEVSDIDYFFTSRLKGEPLEGVEDVHMHAAIPRSARVFLQITF